MTLLSNLPGMIEFGAANSTDVVGDTLFSATTPCFPMVLNSSGKIKVGAADTTDASFPDEKCTYPPGIL